MSLFMSKKERARRKVAKRRRKRDRAYAKKKAKQDVAKKESENNQQLSGLEKALNFIDNLFTIFRPAHSRFQHNRLVQQGTMFVICVATFLIGGISSYVHYDRVEYNKSQAANFMTDNLAFSKSGAAVDTGTPFATQDFKTVYIPLKIEDMSSIDPDASEYHILVLGKNNETLKSRITQAQLISYGSTGHMFLVVHSANAFQSQPVQFLIWSGSDITGDNYSGTDDSDDGLAQFKEITHHYDTLSFTINLGGQSIKPILKTKPAKMLETKTKKDPKTHKATKYKTYVVRQIPVPANKDFYNGNEIKFIYNYVVSGPALKRKQKTMTKKYNRMQLSINRINKDYRALTKAGYKLPKLPSWALDRSNDIAKSLPFSYDQLQGFNLLLPNATFTDKQQKLLSSELRVYNHNQADTDNDTDDDESKENKFADKMSSLVVKNKHTGETLGNGGSDANNGNSNEVAQWNELVTELGNIATNKTAVYYELPLDMWQMYLNFNIATSSGSNNKADNTGAITYSRTSGYNKHGSFLTIYGVETNKK